MNISHKHSLAYMAAFHTEVSFEIILFSVLIPYVVHWALTTNATPTHHPLCVYLRVVVRIMVSHCRSNLSARKSNSSLFNSFTNILMLLVCWDLGGKKGFVLITPNKTFAKAQHADVLLHILPYGFYNST